MAITGRELRGKPALQPRTQRLSAPNVTPFASLIVILMAALAIYVIVGAIIERGQILVDDLRYGRPRAMHISGYVGHSGEALGQPSRFIALNLDRQVVVLQFPGGDANQIRTLQGPYLIGANEDLTPVTIGLHDLDQDGYNDLVIDVRRERVVYLNRDGAFRLPTAEELRALRGATR